MSRRSGRPKARINPRRAQRDNGDDRQKDGGKKEDGDKKGDGGENGDGDRKRIGDKKRDGEERGDDDKDNDGEDEMEGGFSGKGKGKGVGKEGKRPKMAATPQPTTPPEQSASPGAPSPSVSPTEQPATTPATMQPPPTTAPATPPAAPPPQTSQPAPQAPPPASSPQAPPPASSPQAPPPASSPQAPPPASSPQAIAPPPAESTTSSPPAPPQTSEQPATIQPTALPILSMPAILQPTTPIVYTSSSSTNIIAAPISSNAQNTESASPTPDFMSTAADPSNSMPSESTAPPTTAPMAESGAAMARTDPLSREAKIGLGVGMGLLALLSVLGFAFWLLARRKRRRRQGSPSAMFSEYDPQQVYFGAGGEAGIREKRLKDAQLVQAREVQSREAPISDAGASVEEPSSRASSLIEAFKRISLKREGSVFAAFKSALSKRERSGPSPLPTMQPVPAQLPPIFAPAPSERGNTTTDDFSSERWGRNTADVLSSHPVGTRNTLEDLGFPFVRGAPSDVESIESDQRPLERMNSYSSSDPIFPMPPGTPGTPGRAVSRGSAFAAGVRPNTLTPGDSISQVGPSGTDSAISIAELPAREEVVVDSETGRHSAVLQKSWPLKQTGQSRFSDTEYSTNTTSESAKTGSSKGTLDKVSQGPSTRGV